jgi:hypothetical protein
MATVRKRSTITLEPVDEVAQMEAELDSIPERLRAAEQAGDEQAILSAMARERALPALIRAARGRVIEQQLAEHEERMRIAGEEQHRLRSELEDAERDLKAAQERVDEARRANRVADDAQMGRWDTLRELRRQLDDLREGGDQ